MANPLDKNRKMPTIVLCQGLSGEKQKVLPSVAKDIASAGYVVFAFDYAGCGQSEDRRNRPYVFPSEQVENALSAIAYVEQLPYVNSKKLVCTVLVMADRLQSSQQPTNKESNVL